MKSKVEIFMGIIMILMVLSASIYYNSDVYYVQAAKRTNGEGDTDESGKQKGTVDKNSNEEENDKKYTVVIDAGHGETCGRPKNRSLEMLKNGHLMVLYRVLLKCDIS